MGVILQTFTERDTDMPTRTWAEIDLDHLTDNIRQIRAATVPTAEVMAVVKADAYGHGAAEVSRICLQNGATRLAVAMPDEAIALRREGIDAPILILGFTDPRCIAEMLIDGITLAVYDLPFARLVSEEACRLGVTAKIHIKIDTGMGRIGYRPGPESVSEILRIVALQGIDAEGIFTHFATSDEPDNTYVDLQFARFVEMIEALQREGVCFRIRHACNSAALLRFPHMHLDMVRAGLILYGMWPKGCPQPHCPVDLKPVMTLKSSVVHRKRIFPGDSVSYGRRFRAEEERVIATVPIGYADGYSRRLSGRAEMLIRGQRVPVVGNICMDMCMVDVTEMETPPELAEEVVVFGVERIGRKTFSLPVDEISDALDTINYEIPCLIGKRVPRLYLSNGQKSHMKRSLW